MKTAAKLLTLSFGLALLITSPLQAADLRTAARPIALGTAYVGLAENCSSLFINPAGLAQLNSYNFVSMYNQPDPDVNTSVLGIAFPDLLNGTIGLGYRNTIVQGVTVSTEVVDYSDGELLLSYAREAEEGLFLAADLRLISRGNSKVVPGYEGSNGSGSAFDLSAKYLYLPWWQIGLSARDLSGSIRYNDGTVEALASSVVIGNNFKLLGRGGLREHNSMDIFYTFDLTIPKTGPAVYSTGLEWWPVGPLAVRFGLNQTPNLANLPETFNNFTGGLGLKIYGLALDYAFYSRGDASELVTHYISLGFGGPEPQPAKKTVQPEFPSPEPKPKTARTVKRVEFSDLSGHWSEEPAELLATAGLLSGYADGTFRPKIELTREHFSLILLAAQNRHSDDPAGTVGGPDWAQMPQVLVTRGEAAYLMGIKDISNPENIITRGEMAVLLSKTSYGQAAIKRLPQLEK